MLFLLIVFIVITILYYFVPKEVKFEDVEFKGALENYTTEYIPYEVHFSIINPNFKSVNCIAMLGLTKSGENIGTSYDIGTIPKRTKLKYKIPFNMDQGNTDIELTGDCKPNKD